MENSNSPTQETRWLYRGVGLVLGITIVLAMNMLGPITGAAFSLTFMGALLVFSRVF